MAHSKEFTQELLEKLIKVDSVEAAAKVLSDADYEITSIAAEAPGDEVGDSATVEVSDASDFPTGAERRSRGFGFLRDKIADKFDKDDKADEADSDE